MINNLRERFNMKYIMPHLMALLVMVLVGISVDIFTLGKVYMLLGFFPIALTLFSDSNILDDVKGIDTFKRMVLSDLGFALIAILPVSVITITLIVK